MCLSDKALLTINRRKIGEALGEQENLAELWRGSGATSFAAWLLEETEAEGSNPLASAKQSGCLRVGPRNQQKYPPMASFCNSEGGLRTPNSANCNANSPKVSGRYRTYPRFRETPTGDRVQ